MSVSNRISPRATNVENESSIKSSSNQTDTHNVNVTNDKLTQDRTSQYDEISTTILPNEGICHSFLHKNNVFILFF
jgi:hypothetical protein